MTSSSAFWYMLAVTTLHHVLVPLSYLRGVPVDEGILDVVQDPWRTLLFRLRAKVRWSFGSPTLRNEPKLARFADLGAPGHSDFERAIAREATLRSRYALEPLFHGSTVERYRDCLMHLDALDAVSEHIHQKPGEVRALDVGVDDWHYVFVLERWLSQKIAGGKPARLLGIELDGFALEQGLYTAADFARAHAAQTENPHVDYQTADLFAFTSAPFDVVTLFYPYVFQRSLASGGLPLSTLNPEGYFDKAVALTKAEGVLVIFTHTARETLFVRERIAETPGLTLTTSVELPRLFEARPLAEAVPHVTVVTRH